MGSMTLRTRLFSASDLVVCVGTGGVGKTTTAAALALRAAKEGKRVVVMTIDPARRLANAMGLDGIENEPQRLDLGEFANAGGSLDAMMLDATTSFDRLIRSLAGSEAETILQNRVYRVMADHFAGVQEYMALDRLFELHQSGKWDLIVLDTPPAQNAMDFFSAPERVAALFDEQVMRWFLPAQKDASFFRRVFNPSAVVLKLLATVGGEDFIEELSGFFEAIRIVQAQFNERGEQVKAILEAETTSYVVVASPDPRRVEEAVDLHASLEERALEVEAFVLNRSHHRFSMAGVEGLSAELMTEPAVAETFDFYRRLSALGDRDRRGVRVLAAKVAREKIRLVPAFGKHIHSLGELLHLAGFVLDDA